MLGDAYLADTLLDILLDILDTAKDTNNTLRNDSRDQESVWNLQRIHEESDGAMSHLFEQ